ncbi:MAG: hypothetical protein ACRD27_01225, partial [Terracidiphilus sp.]
LAVSAGVYPVTLGGTGVRAANKNGKKSQGETAGKRRIFHSVLRREAIAVTLARIMQRFGRLAGQVSLTDLMIEYDAITLISIITL